jgi:mannose-1-phosphate guanylyltransferase
MQTLTSRTLQPAHRAHLVTVVAEAVEHILLVDQATPQTVVDVVEPTTLTEPQERLTLLVVAVVLVVHQEQHASVVLVVQVSASLSIGHRR